MYSLKQKKGPGTEKTQRLSSQVPHKLREIDLAPLQVNPSKKVQYSGVRLQYFAQYVLFFSKSQAQPSFRQKPRTA